jgi:hypothetical protein
MILHLNHTEVTYNSKTKSFYADIPKELILEDKMTTVADAISSEIYFQIMFRGKSAIIMYQYEGPFVADGLHTFIPARAGLYETNFPACAGTRIILRLI